MSPEKNPIEMQMQRMETRSQRERERERECGREKGREHAGKQDNYAITNALYQYSHIVPFR